MLPKFLLFALEYHGVTGQLYSTRISVVLGYHQHCRTGSGGYISHIIVWLVLCVSLGNMITCADRGPGRVLAITCATFIFYRLAFIVGFAI